MTDLGRAKAEIVRVVGENERLRAALTTIIDRAKNDPDARAYEMAAIAKDGLDEQKGNGDA